MEGQERSRCKARDDGGMGDVEASEADIDMLLENGPINVKSPGIARSPRSVDGHLPYSVVFPSYVD